MVVALEVVAAMAVALATEMAAMEAVDTRASIKLTKTNYLESVNLNSKRSSARF